MNKHFNLSLRSSIAAALLLAAFALPATAEAPSGVVNVNSADTGQLALLPRVGETVAQRIVDFREENGKFETPADLMLVRGIGEKTFELLEPFVRTEGETTLDEKVRVSDLSSGQDDDGAASDTAESPGR